MEDLTKILICNYPDDIVYEDDELDFESTIFNFAQRIVEDMPINKQKKIFGQEYKDPEEMYSYLITHINDLRYELEKKSL